MDLANLSNDQLRHLLDSDEPPTPPCTRKQIRVTLEERRAEEYKQRVDESEARAATAEGETRILNYVWLMRNRCALQHLRACSSR